MKQYVYISQPDLDEYAPYAKKSRADRYDDFGIPLEFAAQFWGENSVQSKMAKIRQGVNVEGPGSIDAEIESGIFRAIREQKKKGVCFSNLGEANDGIMDGKEYFICASFYMEYNLRYSSLDFVQFETDYSPCIIGGKEKYCRIVMGMSVSKMLIPVNELRTQLSRDNKLDVWGRIRKINRDFDLPSFTFKPFVTGFNWISSMTEENLKKNSE